MRGSQEFDTLRFFQHRAGFASIIERGPLGDPHPVFGRKRGTSRRKAFLQEHHIARCSLTAGASRSCDDDAVIQKIEQGRYGRRFKIEVASFNQAAHVNHHRVALGFRIVRGNTQNLLVNVVPVVVRPDHHSLGFARDRIAIGVKHRNSPVNQAGTEVRRFLFRRTGVTRWHLIHLVQQSTHVLISGGQPAYGTLLLIEVRYTLPSP